MEKRKRHYDLSMVHSLIESEKWEITFSARQNARNDFLIDKEEIKRVLLGMTHDNFYRSMTSYHNAAIWQDVYCPWVNNMQAYVKLQIVKNNTVIIQFKKK